MHGYSLFLLMDIFLQTRERCPLLSDLNQMTFFVEYISVYRV